MGPLAILCHPCSHPRCCLTKVQGCDNPAHGCAGRAGPSSCSEGQSLDKSLGSSSFLGHPTLNRGARRGTEHV